MSKESIKKILKEIDKLFENFYSWLAGQYDKETGGFYYARSSRTSEEFRTDIESTAQGLNIMLASNLTSTMPKSMKEGFIQFFQSRQDPDTGYFLDSHNNMKEVDRMVARALSYSSNSLENLGSKPLYPLPGISGVNTLPEHMQSIENYIKWLHNRDWSYSWMACDNISAASVYFSAMENRQRKLFIDTALDFLYKKQDPETGMWGEGRPYVKISGAFKLAIAYRNLQLPMPRVDKIYAYILKTLREDTSEDMCWTRNPLDLLQCIKPQLGEIKEDEIEKIITITYKNLKRYLKPDGGFSRHVEASLKAPNEAVLGKGLVEGDMNASTQALRIRDNCYLLAGEECTPLHDYMKDFYNLIEL